jgi:transposase
VLNLISNFLERGSHKFEELSDEQWDQVKNYLPPQPFRGRKRMDDRRTLNGILYVLQTNCSWRELPSKYGSYETAHRRLKQWSGEGVLDEILSSVKDRQCYRSKLSKYLDGVEVPHAAPMERRKARDENAYLKGEMTPMSMSR